MNILNNKEFIHTDMNKYSLKNLKGISSGRMSLSEKWHPDNDFTGLDDMTYFGTGYHIQQLTVVL